jgi:hypothetical protein
VLVCELVVVVVVLLLVVVVVWLLVVVVRVLVVVPVLVVVVVVVVVGDVWHVSEMCATAPLTGSGMSDIGVPGATLTLNVSVCPVTKVTVIVHSSAEAVGTHARSWTPSTDATEMAAISNFRLLSTVAWLLPASKCARSTRPLSQRREFGSY